jgi:hypothetical protein
VLCGFCANSFFSCAYVAHFIRKYYKFHSKLVLYRNIIGQSNFFMLPCLVDFRSRLRHASQLGGLFSSSPYITSSLPYFLFPSSRDENPVTETPLESAVTIRDARNSLRIRFCEKGRVAWMSLLASNTQPAKIASVSSHVTLFFSCSCALFSATADLYLPCFHVLARSFHGNGGVPPSFTAFPNQAYRYTGEQARQAAIAFSSTTHQSRVTSALVAAFLPECYDLVFHDPC